MAGRGIRAVGAAALMLLLQACVGGLAPSDKPGAGNAITGGEIEVTALDEPAPKPKAAERGRKAKEKAEAEAEEKAEALPPAAAPPPGAPRPKPRPEGASPAAAEAEEPVPEVAPPVAAPEVPEAQKSEGQLACEKRKGVWSEAPNGLFGCVTYTRDGGDQCRRGTDCQGDCLARSGTCSPIQPLFGCNEVLDDSGRRMTQCLN